MPPIHHVEAFVTEAPFSGNPAAVCILTEPKPDTWLQGVAMDMNLSETAFLWSRPDGEWDLRWFTPTTEVDLCGHATLASAHVLRTHADVLAFHTRSGRLLATRVNEQIQLDFPAFEPRPRPEHAACFEAIGARGTMYEAGSFVIVQLERESDVLAVKPDFGALRALDASMHRLIITAPGSTVDFVSRFFAPAAGIDEDPVTGSAHCALAPLWARQLGKTELTALQRSSRGGRLDVTVAGDRVSLRGRARTTLSGELLL